MTDPNEYQELDFDAPEEHRSIMDMLGRRVPTITIGEERRMINDEYQEDVCDSIHFVGTE